jgi:hypothetical protein
MTRVRKIFERKKSPKKWIFWGSWRNTAANFNLNYYNYLQAGSWRIRILLSKIRCRHLQKRPSVSFREDHWRKISANKFRRQLQE